MIGNLEYRHDSQTQGIASVIFPGRNGRSWVVELIVLSYDGFPVDGDLMIVGLEDVFQFFIDVPNKTSPKRFTIQPNGKLLALPGQNLLVSIPAGGVGVPGNLGVVARQS